MHYPTDIIVGIQWKIKTHEIHAVSLSNTCRFQTTAQCAKAWSKIALQVAQALKLWHKYMYCQTYNITCTFRARRFPLPDRLGQVKLPVWQVDLNRFFFFIWYMQIEEFAKFLESGKWWFCEKASPDLTRHGNKLADQSDVAGALPVGVAPTTSSFST